MITKKDIREALNHHLGLIRIAGRLISVTTIRERPAADRRGALYWSVSVGSDLAFFSSKTDVVNYLFETLNTGDPQ